jgi:lysozyme
MRASKKGLMALIAHEGIVKSRYKDSVDVWTIGIGHTSAAGGIDPRTFKGELSIKQCFDLLGKDIKKYELGVTNALKGTKVSQHQFDALVSFHYNTGAIGRASFMNHVRSGDFTRAAAGMMAWRKPPEIIPRRTAERDLFASGKYPNNPVANCYPVKPSGRPDFGRPERIYLAKHLKPTGAATAAKIGTPIIVSGGAVIAAQPSLWPFVIGFAALAGVAAFIILKKRKKS